MPQLIATLSLEEQQFLREAADYLERPGFLMRMANLVGKPAEAVLRMVPESAHELVAKATHAALQRAVIWAIRSLPKDSRAIALNQGHAARFLERHGHTTLAAATGAAGGLFGLAALPVEVPVTTMVMLRSIAHIARQSGADLSDPQVRLQCLTVLSLGEPTKLEAMESAYISSRIGLAVAIREAAAFITQHTASEIAQAWARGTSHALVRLIGLIASRFEITLTEKVAAQAVPIVGSAMGALVNGAFTDHFNRVARFHFGILKLEREHGMELVQAAYRDACAARR